MNDTTKIKQIIEAALFASHEPMTLQELSNLFEKEKPSKNKIKEIIDDLNSEYENGLLFSSDYFYLLESLNKRLNKAKIKEVNFQNIKKEIENFNRIHYINY